jgi:hypothetical protein
VADGDSRPRRALDFQSHPADQVLPEVHDGFARRGLEEFDGLDLFDFANRRSGRRGQNRFGMIRDFDACPFSVREARIRPSVFSSRASDVSP